MNLPLTLTLSLRGERGINIKMFLVYCFLFFHVIWYTLYFIRIELALLISSPFRTGLSLFISSPLRGED